MSRRTVLAAVAGVVLLTGITPVLAEPLGQETRTTFCVRTDSESGRRDGVCLWVPPAP